MSSFDSCHIGKMVFGMVIFAFAIQLFFCLMAVAVAVGNGLTPFFAFSHMLSWPIYFISLALAVILGVAKCIKKCCGAKNCCPESK